MPAEITTDRLRLGAWRDDDLEPYSVMVVERDRRAAAAPRDGRPSREERIGSIQQRQCELSETGIALYAIRVHAQFAGYCGLTQAKTSLDEPEIAYELLRQFHGRGYATEAAHAVVIAAAATGRSRLWASVRTWNHPSFRVLTKIGFVSTDHVTRDEFGDSAWWTRNLTGEMKALPSMGR